MLLLQRPDVLYLRRYFVDIKSEETNDRFILLAGYLIIAKTFYFCDVVVPFLGGFSRYISECHGGAKSVAGDQVCDLKPYGHVISQKEVERWAITESPVHKSFFH